MLKAHCLRSATRWRRLTTTAQSLGPRLAQYDDALKHTDAAMARTTVDEPVVLAQIHHLRGNILFPSGDVERCTAEHQAALDEARRAGSAQWEARALGGLGDASYLAARMLSSFDYFERCVSLAHDLGMGPIEVANRMMVGWTRVYRNELSEALVDGEAAVSLAKRTRQTRAELISHELLSLVYRERGEYEACAKEADFSIELADRLGNGSFRAQARMLRAQAAAGLGDLSTARTLADESIALAAASGYAFVGPTAHTTRALLEDDNAVRRTHLEQADALLAKGAVSHNYFWCYRARLEEALAAGNWALACDMADRLEAFASAEPLPWSDFFVAVARSIAQANGYDLGPKAPPETPAELLRKARDIGFATASKLLESA